MKKTYLAAIAVLSVIPFVSQAQWSGTNPVYTTSDVGIGLTDPVAKLQLWDPTESKPGGVVAATKSIFKLSRYGTSNYSYNEAAEFRIGHGGPTYWGSKVDLYINGPTNQTMIPDKHVMTWNYDGSVGIGTTSPQSKLHVYQNVMDQPGMVIQGNTINVDAAPHYIALTLDGDYGNASGNISQIRSYSNLYAGWGSQLAFFTTQAGVANTQVERLRIDANGYVGIGTSTPHEALSVNGTIRSKEVKVETANWPDYVFKPTYKLPSLASVKAYIDQNQHLPEVPSEQEIAKDGLNLGEMNKLLMKKVEELTLYLIERDKELSSQNIRLLHQQKQIEEQQNKTVQQETRMATLEKTLLKLTEANK